ncbi:MAG: GNAT family N-acetyltransferase [Pseudomonadota bacterium]
MRLRAATAGEAERLSALAFRAKAHWGYSEAFMAASRRALTYPPETVAAGGFHVVEDDGAIRGFSAVVKISPTAAELDALFVEPDCMGRGYGRALLEHALEACREQSLDRLVVQADPHAAAFFEQAGAEHIGERPSECIPDRDLPLYEFRLD